MLISEVQVACRVHIWGQTMTDDELRAWAETTVRFWEDDEGAVPMKVARGILHLLDENVALRAQVSSHCERITAQSALLSKRAEVIEAKS